jgi:hypothetical protein
LGVYNKGVGERIGAMELVGIWVRLMLLMSMVMVVFGGIETPTYTVVHLESDFEIRLVRPTVWVSVSVDDISFNQATQCGVHRLIHYIQGGNLNHSQIPITTPLLTGIVTSAGPFFSSAFAVRFYVPSDFQETPPTPFPELDLKVERWGEKCIAVRQFPGFAKDNNVAKEAALLEASLQKTPWGPDATKVDARDGEDAYTIAEYNPPFHIFGRLNEVWVDIGDNDICHLNTTAGSAKA